MESRKEEKVRVGCANPGYHNEHLCRLMERGQGATVRDLAGDAYVCLNCGARSRLAEVLCRPESTHAG